MSVEIAYDSRAHVAVMYDNTTDWAFGPVFQGPGCDEDAADFLDWLKRNPDMSLTIRMVATDGTDPREYTDNGLEIMYQRWCYAPDGRRGIEV